MVTGHACVGVVYAAPAGEVPHAANVMRVCSVVYLHARSVACTISMLADASVILYILAMIVLKVRYLGYNRRVGCIVPLTRFETIIDLFVLFML